MNKYTLPEFWRFPLFLLTIFLGCEADHSVHQIVDIQNQGQALDETYINFLIDQIDSDPEVSDNYIKLTSIYMEQGNEDEAISLLQKATKETNQDVKILLELGGLYYQRQDIDQLSGILKSIRQKDPENVEFLKLSAGYSLLLKDYTNAIFFANRALLSNPYDDENIFLLASAKLINKDSVSAFQGFEEAYRLKNSGKNFSKLFDLALALNEDIKAKDYLTDFQGNNQDINCCYFFGAYQNAIQNKDSARAILKDCDEDHYSNGRINLELAKTFYPSTVDSVLFHINLFLEDRPEDVPGLVLKAKTLERISYFSDAAKIYRTAIKIDSTSTLALNGLNNLERKVAYLRLVKQKESVQKDLDMLKPLNSKEIN